MNSLIEMWKSSGDLLLINLIVQMTLICLIALLFASIFRFRPALRYGILFSALLSLLLLLPFSITAHYHKLSVIELVMNSNLYPSESEFSAASFEMPQEVMQSSELPFFSLSENLSTSRSISNTSPERLNIRQHFLIPLATFLLGLWFLGLVAKLVALARSQRVLQRMVAHSKTLNLADERRIQSVLAASLSNSTQFSVRLHSSNAIKSPVLVCVRSPVILLPENLLKLLSDDQLKAVFLHELAHLERGDVLANYVQRIVCSVFWFHPGVYFMDRQISRAREEICDNYVLDEKNPIAYSEVLLHLSANGRFTGCDKKEQRHQIAGHVDSPLALGIFDDGWTLEERIKGLLSEKRETAMKAKKSTSKLIQMTTVSLSLFIAACQFSGTAQDQESIVLSESNAKETSVAQETESVVDIAPGVSAEPSNEPVLLQVQSAEAEDRNPPLARTSGTLSDEVMMTVERIQSLLNPEDEAVEADPAAAKVLLDELTIQRYDSLNDFEKQTALNFLTNYYLAVEDHPAAASVFERILTIENGRAETRLRALRALGQLYASFEEWETSNDYYNQWRELAAFENELIYRGLSYNYYQLEQWTQASDEWESYMALQKADDKPLTRQDYAYLNGIYFTADDLEKALDNTKEMILLFNEEMDWKNLRALYSMLDAKEQASMSNDELLGRVQETIREPSISRTSLTPLDGDYLPLVATAPMYPTQAANNAIEGWTLVEFTVLRDGRVDEQSVEVVDAQPATVFDVTSIRAAKQFEFLPRVINGKAVDVPGVQYVFRFKLEEEV